MSFAVDQVMEEVVHYFEAEEENQIQEEVML